MYVRLRLLFWSLAIAVTALSAVGFFADRVERALAVEGASVIAADLAVEQGRPPETAWIDEAVRRGLNYSQWVSFPSVLFFDDAPQLVQVKAVQDGYPLRGDLLIETGAGEQTRPPARGSAVLAERLMLVRPPGMDGVELGQLQLRIAGTLRQEPDLGANLFQLAPRLLVHWQDAQASGLLGPASRARYRLLLSGEPGQVKAYRDWIAGRLPAQARLVGASQARPELSTAIERGQRFLALAALCASLVAGVAIMLATRRFVELVVDEVAVLRTLGMTAWQATARYLRQLLLVTLAAAVAGALAGGLLQAGLAWVFSAWFERPLPAPGWQPVLLALAHALVLVLGFALPSLLALRKVPPLRVLRREFGSFGVPQGLAAAIALAAYAALLYWQLDDAKMAGIMTLALGGVLLVFGLAGALLLRLLQPLRRAGGLAVGLAALSRRPSLTLMQLSGFGLAITLLLLLSLVRVDILNAWQRSLPPDTPNHFLLNIQPDEVAGLRRLLERYQVPDSGFYPTTRARLVSINGAPVDPASFEGDRAQRMARREYSLGFGERLQDDNRLLQGRWWDEGERGFSVEEGVARSLGLEVGDRLGFDVAGQPVSAPLTSLRSVNWDSFNVNFFVQGSPAVLQGLPHALLTSIYHRPQDGPLLRELVQQFPAVSAISLDPLLDKVRGVIGRGALAIEGVFVFTLLAAMLVSVAALQITRDQRRQEIALLRTLGASHARVVRLVMSEFLTLGLVAGVLSAGLSNLLGVLVAERLFALETGLNSAIWLVGPLAGMAAIGLVGYLASRRLLADPPMQLLK